MQQTSGFFDTLTRYGFGERRNMPGLDGLRAIAIGAVFLAHLSGSRGFFYWSPLYLFGQFGVRMFFVISGFLITSILLRDLHKTGRIRLGRFYFRRTMRLFPASYFFIAVAALLAFYGWVHIEKGDLLAASTYTMNFREDRGNTLGHLWTLAIEEQFYLLWPAVLLMLGRSRSIRFLAGVLLLAPVVRIIIPRFADPRFEVLWSDRSFLFWSDALACGCLMAILWRELNASAWFNRLLSQRLFFLIPIAAFLANFVPFTKIYWLACEPFMNVSIALSTAWAINNPLSTVGRVLNWPAVAFAGVLSYSLYLWQQPFLLNRDATSILFAFPLNVVLAIAAAMFSYLLIEAPMLRLRMALERRRHRRRFVSPPVVAVTSEIPIRNDVVVEQVVVLPPPAAEPQLRVER